MKSDFLFEAFKVVASFIVSWFIAFLLPQGVKLNEEAFTGLMLCIGYLIYILVIVIFDIRFPLRIKVDILNEHSPKQSQNTTHIQLKSEKSKKKEIKLSLSVYYLYSSKIMKSILSWLLYDMKVYLTLETSETCIFIRGDSYKTIKPYLDDNENDNNVKMCINTKLKKMVKINDIGNENSKSYNLYIRIPSDVLDIDSDRIVTSLVSNTLIEGDKRLKKFILKKFIKLTNEPHEILLYEQE